MYKKEKWLHVIYITFTYSIMHIKKLNPFIIKLS